MKKQLLLLLFIGLISSCSKDDKPIYGGLGDFSGNYRLLSVNVPLTCTNSGIYSSNDLEITSSGRFKRKMYSLNSNNECIVSEILEGQITINGTFSESPFGIVEYDNSEIIDDIDIEKSNNGVHNLIRISEGNESGVQHTYMRID